MSKAPDPYASWTMTVLKTRTPGWIGNWLIWGVIALVLLGFSLFDWSIQVPVFAPPFPTPSATFVASNDISAFSILNTKNVNLLPKGIQISDEIRHQEAGVYQHITLRAYEKGEEIQSKDLGPKLAANQTYQLQQITASVSTPWMQSGDVLTFSLVNTACSAGVTPTKTCPSQASTQTLLKDIEVVQVGKVSQNGLLVLLVAIPIKENSQAIAFLDTTSGTVIAYPLVTVTTAP